jgi:hypothetical protein
MHAFLLHFYNCKSYIYKKMLFVYSSALIGVNTNTHYSIINMTVLESLFLSISCDNISSTNLCNCSYVIHSVVHEHHHNFKNHRKTNIKMINSKFKYFGLTHLLPLFLWLPYKDHHSMQKLILHLTQVTRNSTQVQKRMTAGNTRIRC